MKTYKCEHCDDTMDENDDVWDGFMGSGTFGVCVKKLKANYFGSELDTEIFNKAKKRIEETI